MTQYIWQNPNWHRFRYDEAGILRKINPIRLQQGKLIQKITGLWEEDSKQVQAIILEQETITTAQIEGERYLPQSVRSSVHRKLGLDYAGLPKTERHIDGLVDVLLDATNSFQLPLTVERLYAWHASLFPTGYSGLTKIVTGALRTDESGPMQVVSGHGIHEKVHYQAPPAKILEQEVATFLNWWEQSRGIDGIIRAGIAHLYFITLHPFDDGNGRLARIITDMALAQDDTLARRYYSLSNEIVAKKKAYYDILEKTQKGGVEITDWLVWFVDSFSQALESSETLLTHVFAKHDFWKKHSGQEINDRQRKVLNKLLDAGRNNFEGGLTTRKYVHMTGDISRRTAIREIQDLVSLGMLQQKEEKGRSVQYDISW